MYYVLYLYHIKKPPDKAQPMAINLVHKSSPSSVKQFSIKCIARLAHGCRGQPAWQMLKVSKSKYRITCIHPTEKVFPYKTKENTATL